VYLPVLLMLIDILLCWILVGMSSGQKYYIGLISICGLFFLGLLLVWIKSRFAVIWIDVDGIWIKRFFGLGKLKRYSINQFEGYRIREKNAEYGNFERLYLLIEGRPIIGISENCYINYFDIKEKIHERIAYLGDEPFNLYK
jgi:hypothetical protein